MEKMEFKEEEWRAIPGTGYLASSEGRIMNSKTMRVLKPHANDHGYYTFMIPSKGNRSVQRYIAYAFGLIDSLDSELEIDHINDVRTDNRISNLQAITHRQNLKKRDSTGMGYRKPIDAFDLKGKYVRSFRSLKEAAECLGLNDANICSVLKGRIGRTGSYSFMYSGSRR
jgi:hypothetical protein